MTIGIENIDAVELPNTSNVEDGLVREVGVIGSIGNAPDPTLSGVSLPGFVHRPIDAVPLHRSRPSARVWTYAPLASQTTIELVHSFNTIPLHARRFVLTSDRDLPSGDAQSWQIRMGERFLASPHCKAILMRSEIACRQERDRFESLGLTEVSQKIQVFRGLISEPVEEFNESLETRRAVTTSKANEPFKVLFVSDNPLRDGLIPTLDAVDRARNGGIDVRLSVVAPLDAKDEHPNDEFGADRHSALSRLSSCDAVRHFTDLSHAEVRIMMRQHHVLLFPTFGDTTGRVIAEAAMEGCPALVTNVFSIPELVEDCRTGMMIPLPKDEFERWSGLAQSGDQRRDAIQMIRRYLRDQIAEHLAAASLDRESLRSLGIAARQKTRVLFDRDTASRQLLEVYRHAFS